MVRINDDLSIPPEVAAVLDRTAGGGAPAPDPTRIRRALVTVFVLLALGLALFLFDHFSTRKKDIQSSEALGISNVVMFSSPRVGIVINDGVLYSGPGNGFSPLAQLQPETRVQVLGVINSESETSWLVVELYGEQLTGWVTERVVEY